MKPRPTPLLKAQPFLIDMEHFNKKLNEGVWAADDIGIFDQLCKPVPGGPSPKEEEDEG